MRLIPGQSGPDRRTSPGHGAGELVAVAVQQLRRGPQRRVVRNGTPARSAQAGDPSFSARSVRRSAWIAG